MTYLHEVKESVQNIADAIAAVLDMDVTIADENLIRIAGTGFFKNKSTVPRNSVFEKAIKTGRSFVIDNPKENVECIDCENFDKCCEKAEICCPIVLNKQVIGIIGIGIFSEEKRENFIKKQISYLNFLEKMANLVAAKVSEQQVMRNLFNTKKELETIINTVDMGILSIDKSMKVTTCNKKAQELLDSEDKIFELHDFDFVFPGFDIKNVFKSGNGYSGRNISFFRGNKKYDFVVSALPVELEEECVSIVLIIQDYVNLKKSFHNVFKNDTAQYTFDDLLGNDEKFIEILNNAKNAAIADSTILITGESGTGKELLARAIHEKSQRNKGLFVAINCAAIPESLLESELFGYEEGAFTGAKKGGKIGKFELANEGTIFLDEIGDMPLYIQVKLLRVIQDKKIMKLGGMEVTNLDLRIIAATNKDLESLIKRGLFREDLYYRLNVIPLKMQPLRERKKDIIMLAEKFMQKYNKFNNKSIEGIKKDAEELLRRYNWPGNVRELENVIEYAVNFEKGSQISREVLSNRILTDSEVKYKKNTSLKEMLEEYEKEILLEYLDEYGHSLEAKKQIAKKLKISKSTLYRKLEKIQNNSQ